MIKYLRNSKPYGTKCLWHLTITAGMMILRALRWSLADFKLTLSHYGFNCTHKSIFCLFKLCIWLHRQSNSNVEIRKFKLHCSLTIEDEFMNLNYIVSLHTPSTWQLWSWLRSNGELGFRLRYWNRYKRIYNHGLPSHSGLLLPKESFYPVSWA